MRTITRTCVTNLIGCASLLALALPALAATITVTNTDDSGPGSLRAAIAAASPGDTIKFALSYPATITLSSTLSIRRNLTINGPGPSNLAISGTGYKGNFGVFSISFGVTAALSGLTIENGGNFGSGGGGISNAGTLTLTNCAVSFNVGGEAGGIDNAGTLTLTNCTVLANMGSSGGIHNAGTLTLTKSTVLANYADGFGGGIWNGGTLIITFSTVSDSEAGGSGGAMYNSGGTVTISNSTFSQNHVQEAGSGGIENAAGTMTVTNSTFSRNSGLAGCGKTVVRSVG